MANPEHVEIVKQGKDTIEKWRKEHLYTILDLREADLSELILPSVDFGNLDISGANLYSANLSFSVLHKIKAIGTDFTGADLSWADLGISTFTNAIFRNAIFVKTDFTESNLCGADFQDATLHYTNFSFAKMKDTCLSRAKSSYTLWTNLDLSEVIGLEKIEHLNRSTIGVDTLMRSHGKIPQSFLSGCGLPDGFVTNIPSHFSGAKIDFYSCFISYSHEDKMFARRLYEALMGKGISCWLDDHQILPGDNIYDRIDHGIRGWDKVLLCASKHSLTSGWVNDELKHAFAKEKQLFKDRGCEVRSLIPLNLDGYLFSDWNHPNKNQVLERMAPDFTEWESDKAKFEQQLERVVKSLQTNNTGREPEPPRKL